MGEFRYPITLVGPSGEATIEALVATGATYTYAPRDVLERIGVRPIACEPFSLADGQVLELDVGTVTARIDGRERPTMCIVGDPGSEPLLGVVTLEMFLLGVDPVNQTLIPVVGRLKSAGRIVAQ